MTQEIEKKEENSEIENTKSTILVGDKPKSGKHLFQKGHKKMGGKVKGQKNKATIEKEIAEAEFKNRILLNIHDLLNAQMNIAKGASYLFRVDEVGEGKEKKKVHILVNDPEEMKEVLDECEGNGTLDNHYYYLTTKNPDNRALDSLIDRVFGKAKESIDISGDLKTTQVRELILTTRKILEIKPNGNRELQQSDNLGTGQEQI